MEYHAGRSDMYARKLTRAINDARDRHGREALTHIEELNAIATEYAETLTRADEVDHYQDGAPSDRAPDYRGLRENLYRRTPAGFDADATASGAVRWWLNSEGHRENLLADDVRVGGLGVATTTRRVYVVHLLATEKALGAVVRDRVAALSPL